MEHQDDEITGNEPDWDPSEISSHRVIEEVKNNPVIYNTDHERYLDKAYRDEVWERIFNALYPKYPEYCAATKVQIGILIRRRWKSLRDSIGHEVKVMVRDPDSYKQRASSILTELMFVIPYIKSKHCEQFSKQMGLTKQSADDDSTNSFEDVSVSNEAINEMIDDDFADDFIKQENECVVYDVKEIDEDDVDDKSNIVELIPDDVKPSFLTADQYESDDPIPTTKTSSSFIQPQSSTSLAKVGKSTTTTTHETKKFRLIKPKEAITVITTPSNTENLIVKYPNLKSATPQTSNQRTTTVKPQPVKQSMTQQSNVKPATVNPQSVGQRAQRSNTNEESARKRPRLNSGDENSTSSMDLQEKLLDVLMTIEHRQLERDTQSDIDPHDLDRMFLLSLLEDLKQIPAHKKIFVKAKIATILARALE